MILGDGWLIEAIARHAKLHFGEIEFVIHEKNSHSVHVDIHVIKPSEKRPFYTLITSGLAQRPMTVPEGWEHCAFAELIMCLPSDWKLQQEYWNMKGHFWPIGLLQWLARYPHREATWLCNGHSLLGTTDGSPFGSGTGMSDVIILAPKLITPEAEFLNIADREIALLGVYPIFRRELDYKIEYGAQALEHAMDQAGITELLEPMRASVVAIQ